MYLNMSQLIQFLFDLNTIQLAKKDNQEVLIFDFL